MRTFCFALAIAASLEGQPRVSYVAAARAAEAAHNFAEAERAYEKALMMHPDAALYQRLGLVRHLENKYVEAIPAFRNSLKIEPNQWTVRLFLGIDLYRTNQFRSALTELERAERLKPGYFEIEFWTGVTRLALKQYLSGLAALEQLAKVQPTNPELLRILAENYALFGTEMVNQVAEGYPESAAGLTIHAGALEFEGANDAALATFETIHSKWPDRPGVVEAIARLKAAVSERHPSSQQ